MGLDTKIVATILLGLFAMATGGFGIAYFVFALRMGANPLQALTWGPVPSLLMLCIGTVALVIFLLRDRAKDQE
ncbi:MAG: hypothetical protein QNI90_03610 [Dinoroseobacter sp.]|nr:hypothetical protein [Dinoroseobacter sp.]